MEIGWEITAVTVIPDQLVDTEARNEKDDSGDDDSDAESNAESYAESNVTGIIIDNIDSDEDWTVIISDMIMGTW